MSLKENEGNACSKIRINRKSILKKNEQIANEGFKASKKQVATKLIDMEKIRTSSNCGIKYYSDSYYEGQLLNGKRNGRGLMVYNTGRVYEGDWVDDYREGKGFEKYANGNTYEGEYKSGKPSGKGIYTWSNGEIYDGEWKSGLKHGNGAWRGIEGDAYIGEWKLSKAEGYGVHVWATGDRYEGEWKSCLKHGNGSDFYSNGDSYVGQYKFGKASGCGRYTWADGSFYVGEFCNGLKSGFGLWKKSAEANCNCYQGQYYNDKKQGFGIFKWASNNVYRGQYKNDEKEGMGEMRWTDGSRYVGMWHRGIQHGYGRMWLANNECREGLFENNIYKEKCEVPISSWFDIMELVPAGVKFSKELACFSSRNFCRAGRANSKCFTASPRNRPSLNIRYTSKESMEKMWCFPIKRVRNRRANLSTVGAFDNINFSATPFERTSIKWKPKEDAKRVGTSSSRRRKPSCNAILSNNKQLKFK
eukprot:TRINITY_DN1613_c0_g2_i1.p1 TRINITY_DN1613_c0_g2~~TRINITY_DN1613_c0_g2_i1.p1  ORF type:complete len:474 (-),score=97.51 TRINITY_DN1613_c0_g2_i1:133-1554(-)